MRVFNPGLLADGLDWVFAYRAVGPDGARRIGICRLDRGLRVVPGSQAALSDEIANGADALPGPVAARNWFADPRLYRMGSRIFVHWNTGWHEPQNHQFLQELGPSDLRPIGAPRELDLATERNSLEKNWTLFGEGPVYAVYRPNPHRILSVPLDGEGKIRCVEIASTPWDVAGYESSFGELRGGAPPQLVSGQYYSICHSVCGTPGDYRYVAAAYRFSARAPFRPSGAPAGALGLPHPFAGRRIHGKLNPAVGAVTYPCGAVFREGHWHVSYGINDEHCAIAVMPHASIEAAIRP